MPTNHFISIKEANSDIERYLTIQETITDPKILGTFPKEVQQYFQDKFLSFVFYKKQIDEMFLDNPKANALRIYNAAHFKLGYETKIMAACFINPDNEKEVANIIIVPRGPGQYPPPYKLLTTRPFHLPADGNLPGYIQQKEGQ